MSRDLGEVGMGVTEARKSMGVVCGGMRLERWLGPREAWKDLGFHRNSNGKPHKRVKQGNDMIQV